MQNGTQIKVCGLTREGDVEAALEHGADAFGFIAYPKSPRAVSLERALALAAPVPVEQRVLVDVEPELETIRDFQSAGFQRFQIHASLEACETRLAEWSDGVGRENLWIAPRLPKGLPLPETLAQYAATVVLDTYSAEQAGGTGQVGDWKGFRELQAAHPELKFILAGGLSPDNIEQALAESGASFVDVNSGVESSPGVKDAAKLAALFKALK
ncbi:MAG: phosphoribosylanthranilate isomerase [Verrucomicrobia bacterium]|nr:phosphoribosylanthranilate isomerase [Verrucomicrobiota bacterium]